MASTYLALTNELLRRLNEVTIDQDDFAGVRNVQALAKDAINSSIRKIIQSAQEWPFTLTTKEQTLTAGTREYDFPADLSSVDWESFYLKELAAQGNAPSRLPVISYTEYLENYRVSDDTNDSGSGIAAPIRVYQTQEEKFGVTPSPNAEYVIEYKYWTFPDNLALFSDTCVIPSRFDHVIIDGAMMYMMRFRSNDQSAQIHQNDFMEGIKMMRRILVDDPLIVRSTYNPRSIYSSVINTRVV
jgi:hypothetical protein